jgi:hypothetical protein
MNATMLMLVKVGEAFLKMYKKSFEGPASVLIENASAAIGRLEKVRKVVYL